MSRHEAENPAILAGRNLRRLRVERRISLSELARLSGVGKATLSSLEAGRSNPTIETLWSLATALSVPFGELITTGPEPFVSVVRYGEAVTVAGTAGRTRLLQRLVELPGLVEVFDMEITANKAPVSAPHAAGVMEHMLVLSGKVRTGPVSHPVELTAGDFVSFAADHPHAYGAPEGKARVLLLMSYPAQQRRSAPAREVPEGAQDAELGLPEFDGEAPDDVSR